MRSTSTAAVYPDTLDVRDHPWFRALETFGIPFLCYASDGIRTYASRDAEEILQGGGRAVAVERQANQAVAQALSSTNPRQIGQFSLVREVATAEAALGFRVYLVQPSTDDVRAVVVVRPCATPRAARAQLRGLTPRQSDVASLVAAGLETKEIAHRLGISSHTTRHHTERVFAKLCVRNRAGVAALLATGGAR
jgi:DNA-binding NarL/FixJ family response regulator